MPVLAWIAFLAAAVLEVAGDAVIRHGLRGRGLLLIGAGALMLAAYGLVEVVPVRWTADRVK